MKKCVLPYTKTFIAYLAINGITALVQAQVKTVQFSDWVAIVTGFLLIGACVFIGLYCYPFKKDKPE